MLLKEEEKNILTGIIGTIAVHLLVLIVFLVARLDKVKDIHKEPIVIEFDEQLYQDIEQLIKNEQSKESKVEPLNNQTLKNIAVNTEQKVEEEISTEKYIEQLKQELNIDELNQQLDRSLDEDPQIKADAQIAKPEKRTFYKGPTRINYTLDNRTDRYIHIPVYKCQGHGKVIVNIVVDKEGRVVNTSIASSTTSEECIISTALESAKISLFNRDSNADSRQKGSISYEFVAQ